MKIGPYNVQNGLALAPMAGVTDRPFRQICKRLGAGLVVSEMVVSHQRLWLTDKTRRRLDHTGEVAPRSVQIVGADPKAMAQAAQMSVAGGAQIVDINMGCPAKKVCNVAAGSALLKDELLVAKILDSVVNAVTVPVTLKLRTGWDVLHKNGLNVARIAQQSGVQALAIHGRTRACAYKGKAEYDTIADIVSQVDIPIFANGDINSVVTAKYVLDYTAAHGLMIGRGAQGRPWVFREISHYLKTGEHLAAPTAVEVMGIVCEHLRNIYAFYGNALGVRIARKHIDWYCKSRPGGQLFWQRVSRVDCAKRQYFLVTQFFDQLISEGEKAA